MIVKLTLLGELWWLPLIRLLFITIVIAGFICHWWLVSLTQQQQSSSSTNTNSLVRSSSTSNTIGHPILTNIVKPTVISQRKEIPADAAGKRSYSTEKSNKSSKLDILDVRLPKFNWWPIIILVSHYVYHGFYDFPWLIKAILMAYGSFFLILTFKSWYARRLKSIEQDKKDKLKFPSS